MGFWPRLNLKKEPWFKERKMKNPSTAWWVCRQCPPWNAFAGAGHIPSQEHFTASVGIWGCPHHIWAVPPEGRTMPTACLIDLCMCLSRPLLLEKHSPLLLPCKLILKLLLIALEKMLSNIKPFWDAGKNITQFVTLNVNAFFKETKYWFKELFLTRRKNKCGTDLNKCTSTVFQRSHH